MNCTEFNCDIKLRENPLDLNIDDYLEVALRNNKKRKFLFVSKNLGKHLPCDPKKVKELGELLAKAYKKKYKEDCNEDALVVGFAETATALGNIFFEYMEGAKEYIHTTREVISDLRSLDFNEEHSHAMEQYIYIDCIEKEYENIILVDDEITTAKTCINIIRELNKEIKPKKYVIVSILNWIDKDREEEINKVAKNIGCKIEFVYLFRGDFDFKLDNEKKLIDKIEKDNNTDNDVKVKFIELDAEKYKGKYLRNTGRFGLNREELGQVDLFVENIAKKLNCVDKGKKILTLGVEEFMYIPLRISEKMEGEIYYHSITRSPIIPMDKKGYPINKKYKFISLYNNNDNYIYNLAANNYDECFLFVEYCENKLKIENFIKILKSVKIDKINIVRF